MGQKITVRAVPAAGHGSRFRAGRKWDATAQELEVVDEVAMVDDPAKPGTKKPNPGQITNDQLAQLKADPQMIVLAAGDPGEKALADAASLAEAQAEVKRLRVELNAMAEQHDAHKHVSAEESRKTGERIAALEQQLANAQSRSPFPGILADPNNPPGVNQASAATRPNQDGTAAAHGKVDEHHDPEASNPNGPRGRAHR